MTYEEYEDMEEISRMITLHDRTWNEMCRCNGSEADMIWDALILYWLWP